MAGTTSGRAHLDVVNVHELELLAEQVVDPAAWAYVAGGSGDEHTLAWNPQGWATIRLVDYWLWALSIGLTEDPARCATIIDWLWA